MIASDDEIVFRSVVQQVKSSPFKNSQPPSATKETIVKGRKSLGRRVSFAATARVCVFDESEESSSTVTNNSQQDTNHQAHKERNWKTNHKMEIDQDQEFNNQLKNSYFHNHSHNVDNDTSPDDEIVLNNKSIFPLDSDNLSMMEEDEGEGEDDNDEEEELEKHKNHDRKEQKIKNREKSLFPHQNQSNNKRIGHIDSFEINIKDQQTSSSISEHFPHFHSKNEEDMDFTRCVGGLLLQVDEQKIIENHELNQGNMKMINKQNENENEKNLNHFNYSRNENKEVISPGETNQNENEIEFDNQKRDSISSVDTAELISFITDKNEKKDTKNIKEDKDNDGERNNNSHFSNFMNNNNNNEEMEMTTCVGGFLSKSPSLKKKFLSSPDFIGNQERPAAFNYASIMSPAIGLNSRKDGNVNSSNSITTSNTNNSNFNNINLNSNANGHGKIISRPSISSSLINLKGKSSISNLSRLPISSLGSHSSATGTLQSLSGSSNSSLSFRQQSREVEDSLFETFMDTEKVEGDFAPSQIAQSSNQNRNENENDFNSHSTRSNPNSIIGNSNLNQNSISNSLVNSNQNSILNSSIQESPTVSLILPRASLQDFLVETGLRFMDNFSSLERRMTQNIPRDLEPLTSSQKAYYASALLPTVDILESGCNDLIGIIGQMQQLNLKLENQFNHHPPLPCIQYSRLRDSSLSKNSLSSTSVSTVPVQSASSSIYSAQDIEEGKSQIISRMRGIKNASRIEAKSQWYQWREGIQTPLNDTLQANISSIENEHAHVLDQHSKTREILEILEPELAIQTKYLEKLLLIDKMSKNGELESFLKMKSDLYCQRRQLEELDAELALLSDQSIKLKESIEAAQRDKASILALIDSNGKSIQTLKVEPTDDVILEIKSQVSLHESVCGWKLDHYSSDGSLIRTRWLRGGGAILSEFIHDPKSNTWSHQIVHHDDHASLNSNSNSNSTSNSQSPSPSPRSNSLFHHIDKIIKTEEGGEGGIPSSRDKRHLLNTVNKLMIDIYSIDRQLKSLPAFDIITPSSTFDNLIIRLPFFYPELKTKFDIDIKIVSCHSSISVLFHSLNCHYGNMR